MRDFFGWSNAIMAHIVVELPNFHTYKSNQMNWVEHCFCTMWLWFHFCPDPSWNFSLNRLTCFLSLKIHLDAHLAIYCRLLPARIQTHTHANTFLKKQQRFQIKTIPMPNLWSFSSRYCLCYLELFAHCFKLMHIFKKSILKKKRRETTTATGIEPGGFFFCFVHILFFKQKIK